jgi:hypothetical protein
MAAVHLAPRVTSHVAKLVQASCKTLRMTQSSAYSFGSGIEVKLEYGLCTQASSEACSLALAAQDLVVSRADASIVVTKKEPRRRFLLIFVHYGPVVSECQGVEVMIKTIKALKVRGRGEATYRQQTG